MNFEKPKDPATQLLFFCLLQRKLKQYNAVFIINKNNIKADSTQAQSIQTYGIQNDDRSTHHFNNKFICCKSSR